MTQSTTETVATCPVCLSPDREAVLTAREWLFGLPGEFPLVRCAECGLGYLAERPTADALAGYYPDALYYSFRRRVPHDLFRRRDRLAVVWYFLKKSILSGRHDYRHLGGSPTIGRLVPRWTALHRLATFDLDVLLPPFVPGGALLEVGCGAGEHLDLMRALGWSRVVGVDISTTAIQRARETLNLEAYAGRLEDIHFPAGTFHAACLSHTLEHLPDPVGTLSCIHRLLKPGGRLAVVVPNFGSLGFRVFRQCWFQLDAPRHLLDFTKHSLEVTCIRAGFTVETLATTARGAYQIGLFSDSRAKGDPREIHTNDQHPFSLARRLSAFSFSTHEHARVAAGEPVGEELLLSASKRPESAR